MISSKEKKGILIVLLSILLIFLIKGLSVSGDVPECQAMKPLATGEDAQYRALDFTSKGRISLTKYGFRKKLVIEEPSVVTQQVGGPPSRFMYFGIFEDEKLTKPVEVANFKWLYKDGDFEEGRVDEPPYDEKKDGVIILEPGVYFAAVYANNPFSEIDVSYLSYTCSISENRKLSEGETEHFYTVKDRQKNRFRIDAQRQGRLKITAGIYTEGIVKVFGENGELLMEKEPAEKATGPVTIFLSTEEGEAYYVEISGIEKGKDDAASLFAYSIRYNYV